MFGVGVQESAQVVVAAVVVDHITTILRRVDFLLLHENFPFNAEAIPQRTTDNFAEFDDEDDDGAVELLATGPTIDSPGEAKDQVYHDSNDVDEDGIKSTLATKNTTIAGESQQAPVHDGIPLDKAKKV